MMTRPNRPRQAALTISEAEWGYICDAPRPADVDDGMEWWALEADQPRFLPSGMTVRELWATHGAAVVAWWARDRAGTRPRAWWRFDAPGPRQRIAGIGTPAPARLAHMPRYEKGVPIDWVSVDQLDFYERLGAPLGVPAIDPGNSPMFESEASFLDRHGLLLPGERRRLRPADFRPVRIEVE